MKKILATTILLLAILTVHAQAFTLHGKVTDETGEALPGAKVILKGPAGIGAITDIDGKFSIRLPDSTKLNVLEFTGMGYETVVRTISPKENDIRVTMKEQTSELSETVIVTADIVRDRSSDSRSSPASISYFEGRPASDRRSDKKSASDSRDIMASERSTTAGEGTIKSGTLTAGEVNDFAKWNLWENILKKEFSSYSKIWGFQPIHRYIAQLTNLQGMPIANANVTLKHRQNVFWQAKTDNTGKAELWLNFFDAKINADSLDLSLEFEYEGKTTKINHATPFAKGINATQLDVACKKPTKVDIFFMVDATSSMRDEMRYLQAELENIVKEVHQQQSELKLRVGGGVYRDEGDEYVTRQTKLDDDIQPTLKFLAQQKADGGGDYPEAVDKALVESIANQNWDDEAVARILFIVLDAPSHTDRAVIERLQNQISLAAKKGIRIVPIVCSDIQKNGEYLMRTIALATNGTYLFLTDDSGVGNTHLKPSTDKYEVEKLNAAVVRIVQQYTQMPDCDNTKWPQEAEAADSSDQYVPNPYDENRSPKADSFAVSDLLQVFPSPFSNILNIKTLKNDVKDVYLVDMTGKMLFGFDQVKRNDIAELDVRSLSTGVYFVKAFYEGKWLTVKVVKVM